MNYDSLLLEPLEDLPPTSSGDGTLVSLTDNRGLYLLTDEVWARIASAHSLPIFCDLPNTLTCVLPALSHAACFSGHLTLNNHSSTDQTVSFFFKKDATATPLAVLNQVPVTSTESLTIDIGTALPEGSSLWASCSSASSVTLCSSVAYNEVVEGIQCVATKAGYRLYPSKKSSFKEVVLCNVSADGTNPTVSLSVCFNGSVLPLVSNVALDDAVTILANFSTPVLGTDDYVLLTSSVENAVGAIVTFG